MAAHMTAHCTSILCVMVGSAGPRTLPSLSPSLSPFTLPLSSSHSHSAAASMGLIDQEGPVDRKPTVGKYTSDSSFFDSYSESSRHSYKRDEEPPSYSERQFGGYSSLPKSGGSQGILQTHTHAHAQRHAHTHTHMLARANQSPYFLLLQTRNLASTVPLQITPKATPPSPQRTHPPPPPPTPHTPLPLPPPAGV